MKTKVTAALAVAVVVGLAPLALGACGSETSEEAAESRSAGESAAERGDDSTSSAAVSDHLGATLVLPGGPRGAQAFVFVAGRMFVVLATVAPVVLLLAVAFVTARFVRRRRLVRA